VTEIGDLDPQADALPADPLTSGQVALYIKAHSADGACEACGWRDWEMCPEPNGDVGRIRGVIWLACRQCNLLRTFLRPPIVRWLTESRHHG
jgi:hypothetical protein